MRGLLAVPIFLLAVLLVVIVSCRPQGYDRATVRSLFDFEEDWELDFLRWRCGTLLEQDDRHATSGRHSLRVELYPNDEYPGLTCFFEEGRMTAGRLVVDIHNPAAEPIGLSWRIDDRRDNPPYADRANGRFVARPGDNVFAVDLVGLTTSGTGRLLHPEAVSRLALFVRRPEKPLVLFVDNVRLEKKSVNER
ncbi:MAG: hypothetical protein ACOY32_13050 [Thermodesulfobacteriota bacterium]